jgi:hypothetical protein
MSLWVSLVRERRVSNDELEKFLKTHNYKK